MDAFSTQKKGEKKMQIEAIDFGGKLPHRAHPFDAGSDVFANETVTIPHTLTGVVRLGVGAKIPHGYKCDLRPRSGYSSIGVHVSLGTIDSGFDGEMCAIVTNNSGDTIEIKEGAKIGQLVVTPVTICDFVWEIKNDDRGEKGFGSSGM
jgi:dUTP pyrophosphatase